MELDARDLAEKVAENEFVRDFIKELRYALENEELKSVDNIQLTPEEDLEFYRKESKFLQDYFKKKLSDKSKGEIYIVTNKYENDTELHRYKVAQYKDNMECKYIAFEKDLPQNVQIQDVVRKVDGKYVYDEQATRICENYDKKN